MINTADPTFWVAICFFGFVGLLYYLGVHEKLVSALDKRSDDIRDELEEARRLREEAQAILSDYQRKQREAEETAQDIINQARKEAEAFAHETRQALKESLERRTQLAEDKIARAEAQALAEVRAAAVDVAINATEKLISSNLSKQAAGELIDQSIQDLKDKLN